MNKFNKFLFLIIILGSILRILSFYFIEYDFPNGYDYALYYEMANNTYKGLGPKLEYIYDLLYLPPSIVHHETYYEPLFGAITGLFLFLDNGSFKSSLFISLISGILSIPFIYIYSKKIFDNEKTALISAFLISINPIMINRSNILMKESFIAFIYIIFFSFLSNNLDKEKSYFKIGIFSSIIFLFQYESLPILFTSFFIFLIFEKKIKELLIYLLTTISIFISYSILFYNLNGIFLSTKLIFFSTPYSGATFSTPKAFEISKFIKKLFPSILYIYRSAFYSLHGLFIFSSIYSIYNNFSNKKIVKFSVIFTLVHIYIHAVSVDLWSQDYIVIYSILVPYCANFINSYNSYSKNYFNFLLFCLIYFINFTILSYSKIIEEIFFYPIYIPEIIISIILSIYIVYKINIKNINLKKYSIYLSILFIIFKTFEFNHYMSYESIYNNDKELEIIQRMRIHSNILKRFIKSDNTVITELSVPFLHFFSNIKLIQNNNDIKLTQILIEKYKPEYIYTNKLSIYKCKYTKIAKFKDYYLVKVNY